VTKVSGNQKYLITAISYNEWIESTPVNPSNTTPLTGAILLTSPTYLSGTKIATNKEWTQMGTDLRTKTPLIWLLETLRTTNYGRGASIEFESDIRLFFLDETDILNFYTANHREQVVKPMMYLAKNFLDVSNATTGVKRVTQYDLISFSRFGVDRQDGMFQNILDANLSGVELRMTMTKYKENCKINC